jgi:hypothetical protein
LDLYNKQKGKIKMKTSLEHRRNNAYLAYKLSGTDWSRNFWRKTYEILEYKYSNDINFKKYIEETYEREIKK